MKNKYSKLLWVLVAQAFAPSVYSQCNMLIDKDTVTNYRNNDTSNYILDYKYNSMDKLLSLDYYYKGNSTPSGHDTIFYNPTTNLVDSVVRLDQNLSKTKTKKAFTYSASGMITSLTRTDYDSAANLRTRTTFYRYNQNDQLVKIEELDSSSNGDGPDSLTTFVMNNGNISTALAYLDGQSVGIPVQFEYTNEISREYRFLSEDFLDYLNLNYVTTAYPIADPGKKFMQKSYTFDENGFLKTEIEVYDGGSETQTRRRTWKCGNLVTNVIDNQSQSSSISPNPATDGFVNLHLADQANIQIFSTTGNLIYNQDHQAGEFNLSTDFAKNGLYIFKFQYGNKSQTERVIIK